MTPLGDNAGAFPVPNQEKPVKPLILAAALLTAAPVGAFELRALPDANIDVDNLSTAERDALGVPRVLTPGLREVFTSGWLHAGALMPRPSMTVRMEPMREAPQATPRHPPPPPAPLPPPPFPSGNWAGYAATLANTGKYVISTEFDLPPLASHDGGCDWYGKWAGIDGFGNKELNQAGVAGVSCGFDDNGNIPGPHQYASFFECLPAAADLMTVEDAGQRIFVQVSDNNFIFINESTGEYLSSANTGCVTFNNSVEWIEEAPVINGSLATLAYHTPDYFWNAAAHGSNGSEWTPNNSVCNRRLGPCPMFLVYMVAGVNNVLTTIDWPFLTGPEAFGADVYQDVPAGSPPKR